MRHFSPGDVQARRLELEASRAGASERENDGRVRVSETARAGREAPSFAGIEVDLARLARDATVPILIEGESGTGKTLAARQVHALSPRASAPFVTVLLSALDDTLASSELFGHVSGAFTDARRQRVGSFASAHRGTLFLDEIGRSTPAVQRKLLHAIEYGQIRPLGSDREVAIDARIVAATSLSLEQAVEDGEFLGDLYARIEVFRVVLPPLRSRRNEIPAIVAMYLEQHSTDRAEPAPDVSNELMAALQSAPWPHNLRQLHATVRRLIIESEGAEKLTLAHCRGPLAYLRSLRPLHSPISNSDIETAIEAAGDNVSAAARSLGLHRATLYRRKSVVRKRDAGEDAV
jgi:two-component system response regulator HupR/HoxA